MAGGGSKQAQSDKSNRYNAIQLQQSAYGSSIALVYGTQRIPGILAWYGDFTQIPHQDQSGGKGGGGGSGNSTYTYQAACQILLCEGPIPLIGSVWADKAKYDYNDLDFTLFTGLGGQSVWSYLTTNHPTQAIPYDHIAHVDATLVLGDSAGMPNLTFEVNGMARYNPAGGIIDAEPSAILTDYCTDAEHGCGFPYLGSLTNWQNYCIALGLFLSVYESTQRPAMDFIKELMLITNSNCWWSPGSLNVLPYADAAVTGNSHTYTPSLTPPFSFGDDDYQPEDGEEPVIVTRTAPSDVFNVIRIEYLDRANDYNTAIAEAKDDRDIALRGERVKSTISMHSIPSASVARLVAQLILQRQLYIRNSYAFNVRFDYSLLEPMDIVSITDSTLGVTNQLIRLTRAGIGADDKVSLEGEELPVGPGSAPVYNWQLAQGYAANYNSAPGSVQTPAIIVAPQSLAKEYELWLAVSQAAGNKNWGGCNVLMSLDNTRFMNVGSIFSPGRYGTLTSTLATGGDPDNTHTLAILLNNTDLTIGSGTTADADNLRLLAYVDGEIISYQTATLTGAGAYNITYLRRGKYGSSIAAHLSGTRFIRLDGNIFRIAFDPGMAGQTAYFKFQSFNIFGGGLEDVAGLTVYNHVISGTQTPDFVARGGCVVTDELMFKAANTSAAWDSDIYSIDTFANGCAVTFQPCQTNLSFMIGLNTDPTADLSFSSLDFAWYAVNNGHLSIYESSVLIADFGPASYSSSSVLSIKYDGQFVTYLQDGVVKRTLPAPGKTFFFDSSFFDPGAAAKNVSFGPLGQATPSPFVARGNCVVSDRNVQKIGGTSAWDSDCYSIAGYTACHVTFKANQNNLGLMVALNTDPATDQSYTSLDLAWYAASDGNAQIYESGTAVLFVGPYTTATVFAITYDATTISYLFDGVVKRTVTNAGLTLFMDSSFGDPGGGINSLNFGPTANLAVADTPQIGANAATEILSASASNVTITAFLTNIVALSYTAKFDCVIECTVSGGYTYTPAGGVVSFGSEIDSSGGGIALQTNDKITTSNQVILPINKSFSFSLSAGSSTTETYAVSKLAGDTCVVNTAIMRFAVIKK